MENICEKRGEELRRDNTRSQWSEKIQMKREQVKWNDIRWDKLGKQKGNKNWGEKCTVQRQTVFTREQRRENVKGSDDAEKDWELLRRIVRSATNGDGFRKFVRRWKVVTIENMWGNMRTNSRKSCLGIVSCKIPGLEISTLRFARNSLLVQH